MQIVAFDDSLAGPIGMRSPARLDRDFAEGRDIASNLSISA